MSDVAQDDIILTAITPADTTSLPIYDEALTYVTFTPNRKYPNRIGSDLDVPTLMRDYLRDNSLVRKLSVVLRITDVTYPNQRVRLTFPERRLVDPATRRCEAATLVATDRGHRPRMRDVVYGGAFEGSHPVFGQGNVLVGSLAVDVGSWIALAYRKSNRENIYLIYKIDSVTNFPDTHSLNTENPDAVKSLCTANLSLVCIHQTQHMGSPLGWTDPAFEKSGRFKKAVNVGVDRVVGYLSQIMGNRRVPGFREFFNTTKVDNDRYAFFGTEDDVIQSVSVDPDEFLPVIWSKVGEYRSSMRDEFKESGAEGRFRPRPLPCGLQFARDAETNETLVTFSFATPGVVQVVTTTISSIPDAWREEPSFYLRKETYEGFTDLLRENDDVYVQKMFTGV